MFYDPSGERGAEWYHNVPLDSGARSATVTLTVAPTKRRNASLGSVGHGRRRARRHTVAARAAGMNLDLVVSDPDPDQRKAVAHRAGLSIGDRFRDDCFLSGSLSVAAANEATEPAEAWMDCRPHPTP